MNRQSRATFGELLRSELTNQVRLHNLIKYLFFFIAFCTLSVSLISSHEDIRKFSTSFTLTCIPLSLLSLSHTLFKQDVADGTIESLATIFSSLEIVLAKYISLIFCACIAFAINLPILALIYSMNSQGIIYLLIIGLLMIISSTSILCLVSAIQSYFRSNTNFLSLLIMPLIIPSIILSGLALQSDSPLTYISILCGLCLIITPVSLILAKYLIKNIYNI